VHEALSMVRAVRSKSDGGDQTRGKQTCVKRYPWSEPFDLNRTERIRLGGNKCVQSVIRGPNRSI
jgi:hypothetical protein